MIYDKSLLKDQVAIVTGGGTGIGQVIVRELARHGADVVITSRDPDHHTETLAEIESFGRRGLSLKGDVRRPEQMEAMAAKTVETFGKIDILVNNAAGNFLCTAESLSPNGWKAVVDIVLNGTFHASKAVLEPMKANGGGNIVSIGATYAWLAAPFVSHSGAAKAGVLNLTRTLAVEWAPFGIRVNAVTPGPIDQTEGVRRLVIDSAMKDRAINMIPLKRFGKREEIAWAILYLLSPAAAYVTGHNLVVDGGSWLHAPMFSVE